VFVDRHPAAFADHAADFWLGASHDPSRRIDLATLNLARRATPRAPAMYEFLEHAIGSLVPVAMPLSMFNLGLEAGRPRALRLLHRPAPLIRFVLVTFVLMPIITLLAALLTSVPKPVVEGLVLMSICPPGLGLSRKALKLTGVNQVGLAWQAFAIPLSVLMIPGFLLLVRGAFGLSYLPGVSEILQKVVTIFLLPVTLGFSVGTFWPHARPVLVRFSKPIATAGQLIVLAMVLVAGGPAIHGLGLLSIVLVVVVVGVAIAVGHVLGGPEETSRPVLASTLALRWPAPALALAAVNDSSVEITPVVLTFVLAGALLMVLYERWLGTRRKSSEMASSSEPNPPEADPGRPETLVGPKSCESTGALAGALGATRAGARSSNENADAEGSAQPGVGGPSSQQFDRSEWQR
jgi:BASS family bile acid:Na+ symporter